MAEIREKAVQAVRWLGAAESKSLAAKAVSGEADGTALIAQEEKIPTWRARDFSQVPVGTPYRWNGQVYKLWQQHDAAGNEGWNPEDAVSLWDICHTTDPTRAKPYVPPQGARGLWQAGAVGFDFFERCGTVWADLEGKTWSEFQELASRGSVRQAGFLLQALRSAMATLTETQLSCVMVYYAQKRSMPAIAQERGVRVSTVSRTLRRALRRLEECILASLKARDCMTDAGFDFLGFAQATDVLTERQREYLYFLLTDGATMGEIARYLEVGKSTVSRGNRHIEENLSAVSPGLPAAPAARKVDKREWRGKSEKEVAVMLAISPAVYFRSVCRGETVGGVSRLAYEILRRRGLSARRAAEELGLAEGTVRRYWKRYEGVELAGAEPPEEYAPAPRRRKPADLWRLLSGGGTVGDCVDAETYRKMMALSAGTGRG